MLDREVPAAAGEITAGALPAPKPLDGDCDGDTPDDDADADADALDEEAPAAAAGELTAGAPPAPRPAGTGWVPRSGNCAEPEPPFWKGIWSVTTSSKIEVSRMGTGKEKGPPFAAKWLSTPRRS